MIGHPRVALDREVLAGKPIIRVTRVSVEFLIGLMAEGWSEIDILNEYPGITHDDILACFAVCARRAQLGEGFSERRLRAFPC